MSFCVSDSFQPLAFLVWRASLWKEYKVPKRKPARSTKSARRNLKTNELPDVIALDRRAIEGIMQQLVPGMTVADSRLDAAQQIMYQAFEETSLSRQMALARKALKVSPNCADAYVLLAEYANTLPEALELYEQGVAAGERALGTKGFQEYEGHFWGVLETRPYMRARAGLADCLWSTGRRDEAVEHCREMLRLNPNDNQGLRYRLASMLLDLQRHDELERLLKAYEDDDSAEWEFARALLAFRREGDSSRARKVLLAATKVNPHVPVYLARMKPMPSQAPEYFTRGDEDEAICYAAQFLPAWKETPGAAAWLRSTLKLAPAESPPKKRETWGKLRLVLSRLPQREDVVWEIDLRAVPSAGDTSSQWMLVVLNATEEQVLHFEFFDERPKDAEAWQFLTATLRAPQFGEPHRPATVRVTRKTWFRVWQQKLHEISIECQFNESLDEIDRWYQTVMPHVEKTLQAANESSSAEEDWSRLASLPQVRGEIWQADVQQLPAWIQVAGEAKRPWVGLVVDIESEAILATQVEMEPADDWLLKVVWEALCSPAAGEPHRPAIIHAASDRQREILAERLEPFGIQCVRKSDLKQLQHLVGDLATHFGGQQQPRALIHSPGVTIAQVGNLFEAAAHFYRARPWREIPGDSVIRIACDRFNSGPWYAVVMGQSGIEQGLALYEDQELLGSLLSGHLSDEAAGRRTSAISVTYGERFDIAPDDLDAAEQHGWPVAGPEAYPCVLRVNPGMAIRTPLKWELELLEGCLRSIPDFLGKRDGKAEVAVSVSGDTLKLQLELMDDGGHRGR